MCTPISWIQVADTFQNNMWCSPLTGLIWDKQTPKGRVKIYSGGYLSTHDMMGLLYINSSPHPQNGRHFADDIFKCIFLNEKFCIFIRILLKYVHKSPIDNKWALIQVMDWHQTGNKSLSEPKLIQFTDTYIRHFMT